MYKTVSHLLNDIPVLMMYHLCLTGFFGAVETDKQTNFHSRFDSLLTISFHNYYNQIKLYSICIVNK